jgi:8-oxo-dGTP pyrophosphatase MutT (NUDIX family)
VVNFNVGIKAIIANGDKVLMVQKANERAFWEGPGGRIDGDETVLATLERELREELPGIQNIQVHELLHADRVPGMALGEKGLFLVWYRVEADFPEGIRLSDEHQNFDWFTKEQAREVASFGVMEAIEKL